MPPSPIRLSAAVWENDPGHGRRYCRFQQLESGINLGAEYYAEDATICVYLGVHNFAQRKPRALAKELGENHVHDLDSQLGQELHWSDPYFSVSIPAQINDRADWPRQHKWIRDTAEKFVATFKPRLGLDP